MKDEHKKYLITEIHLYLLTQKYDVMKISTMNQTFMLHTMFNIPTSFFEEWIRERDRRLKMSKKLRVQGLSLLGFSVQQIRNHTKASPNDIIYLRKAPIEYNIPDKYKPQLDSIHTTIQNLKKKGFNLL